MSHHWRGSKQLLASKFVIGSLPMQAGHTYNKASAQASQGFDNLSQQAGQTYDNVANQAQRTYNETAPQVNRAVNDTANQASRYADQVFLLLLPCLGKTMPCQHAPQSAENMAWYWRLVVWYVMLALRALYG